jgi:uncharacterized cupin superfamily protein
VQTIEPRRSLLPAHAIAALPEARICHPWNAASEIHLRRLSDVAGLRRLSLSIARLPPGRESFVYHRHERDEELVFILSGRGRAEIGGETVEVGAGDFMGFAAPDGPPHHLSNPFGEDLVYLMGGERSGFDIGYFPRLGRRLVFTPSGIWSVDVADVGSMTLSQWHRR